MQQARYKKASLTQVAQDLTMDVQGLATMAFDIVGTFVGTVIFEYTINNIDWYTLTVNIVGSSTTATGATAPGQWKADVSGYLKVRIRCSAFTSGSIDVAMQSILSGGGGSGGGGLAAPAGENHIGSVGSDQVSLTATPTISNAGAHASGDYVGLNATAIVFDNAARIANGGGLIQTARLIDKAKQSIPAELWLFDSAITPPNGNAAWDISDADVVKCIGVIPFNAYFESVSNSIAPVNNLGFLFKTIGNDDKIYGAIVTRGAPTYADGDVVVELDILQN